MYEKIWVILFVTIFCYGVTYSSPTKENVSELISKEKQAASIEVNSQIRDKIEATTLAPKDVTPNVKPSSNHSEADTKNIPKKYTANNEKVISQVSDVKNNTQSTSATLNKNPDAPLNSSTTNNIKPTSAHSSTTVPAISTITVTDLPPTNYTDMSRPIIAGVPTSAAGTTTKALVTKPTTQTPTATFSTSTDSAPLEHTSTKAQENRFDGASFVGGIILTIGLTAIGFIAFKYYKSGKIDANYRTL